MDDGEDGLDLDGSPVDEASYMTVTGMSVAPDMQADLPTHVDLRSLSREPMGPAMNHPQMMMAATNYV